MNLADLATIGKVLGVPGAMIMVWYLLEKQRGTREAAADMARINAENRRTDALETGFRSLAELVTDHAHADQAAHSEQGQRLAAIETQLSIRVKTPARGVTTEHVRRTDGR